MMGYKRIIKKLQFLSTFIDFGIHPFDFCSVLRNVSPTYLLRRW